MSTEQLSTGHPAPWPLLDLDVARQRARGHRPVPFRQFILKIQSTCNLSCTYCYVYEMADQGWRDQPRRMSAATVEQTVQRIAEHARAHDLRHVEVVLHGGEPLLAGADWITGLVQRLRAEVPAEVAMSAQTNGTVLTPSLLRALAAHGVRLGVSLDGGAVATGRHRLLPSGRSSFPRVAAGLRLLNSPEFRDVYSGLLCTVDVHNDPVDTYEELLAFEPPALDLLLPHAHWGSEPRAGHGEWLIAVFDRWYSAVRQETSVRMFEELIQLVYGAAGAVETLGLLPASLIGVDTDGSIRQLDSLAAAYDGAAHTGLHVAADPFDAALDHPTTVARQIGADALSDACRACPVMDVCGGGFYPHRYRPGAGFRNPSVYCADLKRLIEHVSARVLGDLARLGTPS
ncbi:FxsB family cyclophane-forming radical SAM/SPASM peptide maturase [Actinomadura hibisca]|uniref:FxsB family cyclophane-forming radical SAM/SPASM peptide maturase n=1 Tax=Actinomadura hibisca TaxID=68565 RepID=UPI00083333E4|nr:FxsB family cyclophane-forming radical SAM/SPASM peptide maturase [Actinomadura hibisca]